MLCYGNQPPFRIGNPLRSVLTDDVCDGASLPVVAVGGLKLAILAVALSCAVAAQQSAPSAKLPDAPSSSQTAQNPNDTLADVPVVNLLAGRSLFIPNLAVNTRPLTTKQKFYLAASNTVSGINIIGTAAGAGISQARNTKTGYGQGAEGYFKRWGAGMAYAATTQMVGTFAIASMLHEDPRYFVQDSGKFGQSVKYAVSRVFICRMDNGKTGTNWAGILGPLAAAGVANTYLPSDSQGIGNTFENYGLSLAIVAGTNVLREYWPHINKKLRLPSFGMDSSSPSTVQPGDAAAQPVNPPTPPSQNPPNPK